MRKSLAPWLHDSINFYQHQVDGVRLMIKRRSMILADDMGLGKSLEALTAFAVDVVRGWAETMIVIAPPTLKGNWAKEIETFTTFPYIILDGTPGDRMPQLFKYMAIKGPKILIIGYEQCVIHERELGGFAFDIAVYDEAHYIKSPTSVRTKAVLNIRSRRSFMLTGTPLENRIDELWCLFHRVDPERYPSYHLFLNRYAAYGGYNGKQIVGVKNESELINKLNGIMIRRLKKDVLDLPDVQYLDRSVDLYDKQRELYDMIDKDLQLVRPDQDEPEMIEHAFTKIIRLRQVCSTLVPFTGEDISVKLDLALAEDEEILAKGEKIVVFTQFRPMLAAYIERAQKLNVPVFSISGDTPALERPKVADRWSATKGPAIFVAMQQVAYAGLTLVAAKHGSFLDEHYNPQKNQQAVDRLHRIGASESQPVQIRRYMCRKTIETRVRYLNTMKRKLFDTVVNSDIDFKRKLIAMLLEKGEDDDE